LASAVKSGFMVFLFTLQIFYSSLLSPEYLWLREV